MGRGIREKGPVESGRVRQGSPQMPPDSPAPYDVAVVGLGPVGATLAVLLGRRGLRVVALDRDTAPHSLPRAAHLDGHALRVLAEAGAPATGRPLDGFDLVDPTTSVSMTINGPAPMILAYFLNTAIDQAVETRLKETNRWQEALEKINKLNDGAPPQYRNQIPAGHDGTGLGLLGATGDQLLPANEYAEVKAAALQAVRGTVQADILKEDQAQNTCIFSTEFALKMMGDVQQYFIDQNIRNFYSVSISGYHIAEAGANPITQAAAAVRGEARIAGQPLARTRRGRRGGGERDEGADGRGA